MKKISLAIASVLLFTACLSSETPVEETPEFNPTTAQEQLDASTVVTAVQTKNIELCGTVENSDQEAESEMLVEDQVVFDEAKSELAVEKCAGIQKANTKEKCEMVIEGEVAMIEEKENIMGEIDDQNALLNEIVQNGDISACDELEDENFKNDCKDNILIDLAIESGDSTYCDQMTRETNLTECKSAL
jgi:hypothetical protein